MAININAPLKVNAVDDNGNYLPKAEITYGPYESKEAAVAAITSLYGSASDVPLGVSFGIVSSGTLTEYQYKTGAFNTTNCIEVGSGSGGGSYDDDIDRIDDELAELRALIDTLLIDNPGGSDDDDDTPTNLYNVLGIQMETGIDETNGFLVDSPGRCATATYIPVKSNTSYTMTSKYKLAWYDSSKTFISGSGNSETATTYVSPDNAAYCRISFNKATTDPKVMVFNEGTTLLQGLAPQSLPTATDLVDHEAIVTGEGIQYSDGSSMTSSTSNRTDYFAVLPNTEYAFYYRKVIAWYDSNKNFISAINSQAETGGDMTKMFTSPSNAAYCRFSVKNNTSSEKTVAVQGRVAYLGS